MDIESFNEHISSMSFYGSEKFVYIKNMDLNLLVKSNVENFINILNKADESIFFVFSFSSSVNKVVVDSFIKKLKRKSKHFNLTSQNDDQKVKFVMSEFKNNNCSISKNDAEFMIQNISQDFFNIENEINKLSLYKLKGDIKAEDIDKLVVKSAESSVFMLIDFIIKSNNYKCFELIYDLINQGEDAFLILNSLIFGFVDIYRLKLNKMFGEDNDFLEKNFMYKKNDFRIKKAGWYVDKFSYNCLSQIIECLYQTDKMFKTSSVSSKILLDVCVVKILTICNERSV